MLGCFFPIFLPLLVKPGLISYHSETMTLVKVLKALSPIVGEHLDANDLLKDDVVVVDVKNVYVKDLLEHIENVELGKWVKSGSTLILVPSETKISENQKRLADARLDIYKSNMDAFPDVAGLGDARGAKVATSFQESCENIVRDIGLSEISAIPSGQRIVFSTQPNEMQVPFPASAQEDVSWTLHLIDQKEPTKIDFQIAHNLNGFDFDYPTFTSYSADGKIVESTQIVPLVGVRLKQGGNPSQFGVPAGKDETPILLNGTARKMADYDAKLTSPGHKSSEISDEIRKIYLQPTKFDPMLAQGGMIAGMAEIKNLNLVASLVDNSNIGTGITSGTAGQVYFHLMHNPELDVQPKNSWLEIRPKNLSSYRVLKLDRAELEHILSRAAHSKVPTVDEVGEIAAMFHGTINNLGMNCLGTVQPSWAAPLLSEDLKAAEFFGNLSDIEKQDLNHGKSIAFGRLNASAKAVAVKMAFGPNFKLLYDPGIMDNHLSPAQEIMDSGIIQGMSGYFRSIVGPQSYLGEPTEVAPHGLTNESQIIGKISKDSAYSPVFSHEDDLMTQILSALSMSENQLVVFLPTFDPSSQNHFPSPTGYKVGTRTTLSIKIYLAPGVYVGGDISQDDFTADAKIISPAQFPETLKNKIAIVKKYQEDQKKQMQQNQQPQKP